jgi:monovalent cation/hydrogen antiporter
MALFELTLALLFGAVIVAGLARKAAAPYPAFLALAGPALAFLPRAPVVEIEPDLALSLFVAPTGSR